jgi:hypothetical protein
MTQPYGKPYTVRGWGDEIVTTVSLDALETVPDGYLPVLRTDGPVILVPTAALTPVDTTPTEPEPGAWLIGDTVYSRFAGDVTSRPWTPGIRGAGFAWFEWAEVWKESGGPGVTIRRLIPEPAPVEREELAAAIHGCGYARGETPTPWERVGPNARALSLARADAAIEMFARAAREATR